MHEIDGTCQLSNEMRISLLNMERRLRPVKNKACYSRLKEQYEENRKKEDIQLRLNEEKFCEKHLETLFYAIFT